MLKMFMNLADSQYMSIEEAQHWDQRPFRSMLIQGWVKYYSRRGFQITKDGRRAWFEFLGTDIARKDPSLPLTAYFHPSVYGLKKADTKKLSSGAQPDRTSSGAVPAS